MTPELGSVFQRQFKIRRPDISVFEGFKRHIQDALRDADRSEVFIRLADKRSRRTSQKFFQVSGRVDDFQVVVKNENRILGRRHDGIEKGILANRGGFIGNEKKVTDRCVIFDKQVERDVPPEDLSVLLL